MSDDLFFKHPKLPFAECRYSKSSGRHYKPHMHRTFSVGAVDQGEVIYQVQEKVARLRPGSLALINPEALHTCNPVGFSQRSYYILHLDVGWCFQVQQSLWRADRFCPASTIILKNELLYRRFIDTMESLICAGDLQQKRRRLGDVAVDLFLHACEPVDANKKPSRRIEQLKLQLSGNLDTGTSLKQLSLALHANPYTLLRQFKASVGITPHAYRLNCRIERARTLLQKGLDVSQVALECGFFDQSHFHRHFKAMTTVTPKEYQVNFIQ